MSPGVVSSCQVYNYWKSPVLELSSYGLQVTKNCPRNREEVLKSLCHGSKISVSQQTLFLQIWQKKKRKKELTYMTYLCMIALGNKTVAHTFLLSFDNVNGCLCQERWLTSITLAKIGNLTSHFSSLHSIYSYEPV